MATHPMPAHPYTQRRSLLRDSAAGSGQERRRQRIVLEGDLPSPASSPSGCRFRTRCQKFANKLHDAQRQRCIDESPASIDYDGGRQPPRVAIAWPRAVRDAGVGVVGKMLRVRRVEETGSHRNLLGETRALDAADPAVSRTLCRRVL